MFHYYSNYPQMYLANNFGVNSRWEGRQNTQKDETEHYV